MSSRAIVSFGFFMLATVLFGTIVDIAEPALYLLAMAAFAIAALLMALISRHRQAVWERSFHIHPQEPEDFSPAGSAAAPARSAPKRLGVADLPPSLPAGQTHPA